DFIYVLLDDGSTDNTLEIIREYEKKDNRIVVISKEHSGLVNSLNEGLVFLKKKCELIARMDGDDTSDKFRFEKQIEFLNKNNLKICSTWMHRFDKNKKLYEKFRPSFDSPLDFKEAMLKMNFIVHGSVMFYSDIIDKIGFYP